MWRVQILFFAFLAVVLLILGRLFYWQVIFGENLKAAAEGQYTSVAQLPAARGKILTAEGFVLVGNKEAYLLAANPAQVVDPEAVAGKLTPILAQEGDDQKELFTQLFQRLSQEGLFWVALAHKITPQQKTAIETLAIEGLLFENEPARYYPEASIAAHLLGFVGQDAAGREQGYFGLEGYYDLELRGRSGVLSQEKDASGLPILIGGSDGQPPQDGKDLHLSLDRAIQFMVEEKLDQGLTRYGAKAGSVVIMEPETGKVQALAARAAYHPGEFGRYDRELYRNPVVAEAYEPGSTFKVLVLAAALEEKAVTPETKCDACAGPRRIGQYLIRTWNNDYHPEATVTEIIQYSDNVGMVFVSEKLGTEKLVAYLKAFGLGEKTGIDLEDEASPSLRPLEDWGEIDRATASFGQGVALTPIQMVRAVTAIANQGKLVKPAVVEKITDKGKEVILEPEMVRQVISPATARVVTELLVNAVEKGEARWAAPKGYRIAGKTGTSQIPVAGHYDEEKTIVSFVGFAPANNPRFVMLVTLNEPTSSPWGSETAAPLWFDIARELFLYLGVKPQF